MNAPVNPLHVEIVKLRERNEELAAEVANLRDLLRPEYHEWVPGLYLTASEEKIFAVLMRREMASRRQIMFALHQDDADERCEKACDVLILRIRRKLRRYDLFIETIWGRGWRIPAALKARIERGEIVELDPFAEPAEPPTRAIEPEPQPAPQPEVEPVAEPEFPVRGNPPSRSQPGFIWLNTWGLR